VVDLVLSFDDPALEAALREALNLPEGPLRRSDLQRLTALAAGGRGISDLTGLEYAQNLRVLDLSGNDLTDIDALSGLTALRELYLEDNAISDLGPLSFLRDLRILDLAGNLVTDLRPLANLSLLTELNLSENGMLA